MSPTWSYLSVITFLLEFTVMKELINVFMHVIQKPATEKILVKGLKRSVNTCYYALLLCMMWLTQYMLPGPHSNDEKHY